MTLSKQANIEYYHRMKLTSKRGSIPYGIAVKTLEILESDDI